MEGEAPKEQNKRTQEQCVDVEVIRDDLENIYMLIFRFVGMGFRLALCNVSWVATRVFVVLVPNSLVFAPWVSAVRPRRALCDSCQDMPCVVVLCFLGLTPDHKSTGRADFVETTKYWMVQELEWEDSQKEQNRGTLDQPRHHQAAARRRWLAQGRRLLWFSQCSPSLSCQSVFLLRDFPRSAVK